MTFGHETTGGNVDKPASRRSRNLLRRAVEQGRDPIERQIAGIQARNAQQRCVVVTFVNFEEQFSSGPASPLFCLQPFLYLPYNAPNGRSSSMLQSMNSDRKYSDSSSRVSKTNSSDNAAKFASAAGAADSSDFLVNNVTMAGKNVRRSSRKKGKKKGKRHRRAPSNKEATGPVMHSEESMDPASSFDTADSEALTLSPTHVMMFDETTSRSSSMKEVLVEAPESENSNEYHDCSVALTPSTSCSDETEESEPTTSYQKFCEQFSFNRFSYLDNASDSTNAPKEVISAFRENLRTVNCNQNNGRSSSSSVSSDSCRASLMDPSLDGWNSDISVVSSNKSSSGQSNCFSVSANLACSNDVSDICNSSEQALRSHGASNSSDFHVVISRKRAKRRRNLSVGANFSGEIGHSAKFHGRNGIETSHSRPQVVMKHDRKYPLRKTSNVQLAYLVDNASRDSKAGVKLSLSADRKEIPPEGVQKCSDSGEVVKAGLNKVLHDTDSSEITSKSIEKSGIHCSQMKSSSAYEVTIQKYVKEAYTSGVDVPVNSRSSAIQKDGLDGLVSESHVTNVNAKLLSPGAASQEPLHMFNDTIVQSQLQVTDSPREQTEQAAVGKICYMDCDSVTEGASYQPGRCTANCFDHSITHLHFDENLTPNDPQVGLHGVPSITGCQNSRDQRVLASKTHLEEMMKVAHDAYKLQVSAETVYLLDGIRIADFETFLYSASPVIDGLPRIRSCKICSKEQLIGASLCQHQTSNIFLKSIWEWYDETGCYGLEVRARDYLNQKKNGHSEFSAYYVPYVSAIQLFGPCNRNMDENLSSEVIFEYFESEQPSLRRPLFETIKELVGGVKPSNGQMFGNPQLLANAKLHELHPASWFSVAWYPICRIPHGNIRAAFLTYHSLGKLIQQTSSSDMDGQHTRIVAPAVGLQNYNEKGEWWFQLRDDCKSVSSEDGPGMTHTEFLNERLRTLKHSASVMAKAVVPKGNGSFVNWHPDYEFFLARRS